MASATAAAPQVSILEILSTSAQSALVQLIDARLTERLGSICNESESVEWLTVAEAAEKLRTTPGAIYKRIKRKQLRSYRPEGSPILLRRNDLDPRQVDPDAEWSYDDHQQRPREAVTSGAVTPGGKS